MVLDTRPKYPALKTELKLSQTDIIASRLGRNRRWGRTCADTGPDWSLLRRKPRLSGKKIDLKVRQQIEEMTRQAELMVKAVSL